MGSLQELSIRLSTLAVFRELQEDAVINSLRKYLAEPSPALYASFVSALYRANGGILGAYVREICENSENVYVQAVGKKEEIPAYLREAVLEELKTQVACYLAMPGEESPDSGEISLRRGANTALLEQIPRLRGKDATVYDVLCEPFAEVFSVEAKLRELEEKMTEDFERYADAYTEAQSRYAALGGYDAETRLKNIVQGFKLNDLLERPYNVLSGGQKTVVNLAAVVLREPDILLLDEPTNHLDMQTLDWFEGFLAKYRGTVLMVSHDRRFLDRVATRTLILEDGICTSYPGGYTAAKEEQERQMLLEFEQYKNQQK